MAAPSADVTASKLHGGLTDTPLDEERRTLGRPRAMIREAKLIEHTALPVATAARSIGPRPAARHVYLSRALLKKVVDYAQANK
jgi:hypothetical protein